MTFQFRTETIIDAPIHEVFSFFSKAENLERITPPWLKFRIITPPPIKMMSGTLIDYNLSLYGIPFRWQTEIETWEPPHRFVDRQLKGPYKSWIHEHIFIEAERGCIIKDHVTYSLYGGYLGSVINSLFVRRDIMKIFQYRKDSITQFHSLSETK
jgi:ligand-binding SRPBCC domain-containing protein